MSVEETSVAPSPDSDFDLGGDWRFWTMPMVELSCLCWVLYVDLTMACISLKKNQKYFNGLSLKHKLIKLFITERIYKYVNENISQKNKYKFNDLSGKYLQNY